MSEDRWLRVSGRLVRLLLRLYPADFREELGEAVVEAYRDRCREAYRRGGAVALGGVWLRTLADSLRNGIGERVRPAVAWRRSGNWGRDAERVVKRLVRAPVFTLSVVGTLTVGLGAFAVVYAVVDSVLLEPLPYERPDDLYYVWRDYGPIFALDKGRLAGTDVAALAAAGGAIEGAVGLDWETPTLSGGADAEPEEVAVMRSSPGLFEMLGVRPAVGRGFAPDEAGPGGAPAVVLGHDLWRRRFGGDPGVVGSEIRLDGRPFTVIGVMGPGFRLPRPRSLGAPYHADVYTTVGHDLAGTDPLAGSYLGLIRARPGTPAEAVQAAVAAVGHRIDEKHFRGRGLRLYPVGMKDALVEPVRPGLRALALAGVVLVFVLGVNLGALLLARAAHREREFAISRAMGANGPALMRAMLLEGGLLGLLGGAGGALAAVWGTRVLVALAPLDWPRREQVGVDGDVAAVVIATGTLLGLLAAAAPATWAARTRLSALLGAAAVRGGGGHGRLRRGMVVAQVALSLVLLCAGGLVVRSFERLLRSEPGFDPAGVLTFRVPVPSDRYPDAAAVLALHERIQGELAALPGVRAVGATSALPLSGGAGRVPVAFPGAPGNTGNREQDRPLVDHVRVRPGFFEAMGIVVRQGRPFGAASPAGVREALIDGTLAERFYPAGRPLGGVLVVGGDSLSVIGVVEHARIYDLHRDGRPQVYLRNDDYPARTLTWTLRTDRPPLGLVPEVRASIRRIDPELALADVRSMDQVVSDSLRQQRVSAVVIASFALGALLLTAMGLYGVISGSVLRRRHELAVRLALGAEHGRVLRLVVGEGARLVALGVLIGAPGIYLSARVVGRVLVGVSPFDPPTLVAVTLGLALVAVTACYLPARRVLRIEPARLLRQE